jgi:hypothetical protein
MNIFQFINRLSLEPCLREDALYLAKGKWFRLDRVQFEALHVASLKEVYGEHFDLTLNFSGKILIKAGVRAEGKSFVWCGEKTVASRSGGKDTCKIDLSKTPSGTLEISLFALEESAVFSACRPVAAERNINQKSVLYEFLSPTYEVCCEEPLYYKFSGEHAYYSFVDKCVHMNKDSSVDLLTYFNAFSAIKWKKYTNVDSISIYITFKGKAQAEIIHISECGTIELAMWELRVDCRTTLELPLGEYPDTGIIGLRIHAEQECVLYGGGYLTDASETQPVHLGIGITTYRREETVKAAVARLGKTVAEHPLYHDAIDITVVDNGQTLIPEDVPAAKLISSRNLGGTGGFTRSLIHYQEEGKHTHCLFMDDDVSCEAGAIFRSMSFIRHALDQKLAVSGAMLYENMQFLQWENGAWFDCGCHSLNRNLDLRDSQNLLSNEEESKQSIYGAWWFFFFPIAEAKRYPLPFFVRGDDIDFSYSNDFLITTLNGIACWQQDFKTKENAMTAYLFLRSHIVHHLTIPRLKCTFRIIWKILRVHFAAYNNSYFYGTAACVNLAIKHVLQGPEFWEKNIVPVDVLKQIKELSLCEKPEPYTEQEKKRLILAEKNLKTAKFPIFIRKASLYGHLLPKCMMRHTPFDMIFKSMMPNRNRVYMRDQIIILDLVTRRKTVLKRSPKQYFANFFEFLWLSINLYLKHRILCNMYISGTKHQRTRDFWKKQFIE